MPLPTGEMSGSLQRLQQALHGPTDDAIRRGMPIAGDPLASTHRHTVPLLRHQLIRQRDGGSGNGDMAGVLVFPHALRRGQIVLGEFARLDAYESPLRVEPTYIGRHGPPPGMNRVFLPMLRPTAENVIDMIVGTLFAPPLFGTIPVLHHRLHAASDCFVYTSCR